MQGWRLRPLDVALARLYVTGGAATGVSKPRPVNSGTLAEG